MNQVFQMFGSPILVLLVLFVFALGYLIIGAFLKGILIRVFGRARVGDWESNNSWLAGFPLIWAPYITVFLVWRGLVLSVLLVLLPFYLIAMVLVFLMSALVWLENGFSWEGLKIGFPYDSFSSIFNSWVNLASRWLLGRKKQPEEIESDVSSPNVDNDDVVCYPV